MQTGKQFSYKVTALDILKKGVGNSIGSVRSSVTSTLYPLSMVWFHTPSDTTTLSLFGSVSSINVRFRKSNKANLKVSFPFVVRDTTGDFQNLDYFRFKRNGVLR